MANYNGTTRSNEFLVNDKEKAEAILGSILTDGEMHYDINPTEQEGIFKCWFGSYGNIYGLNKNYLSNDNNSDEDLDDEEDYDLMISELQSILVDGEVINIVDIGYEKLRYVGGGCLVITKNNCKYIDIIKEAEKISKELLDNEETV